MRPFSVDQRVERIGGLEIGEVGPGAEHAQRPQLAPVLVRDDIVRIVGPGAGEQEVAEDLAGNQPAGDDAIRAVGVARDRLEDGVHVVAA